MAVCSRITGTEHDGLALVGSADGRLGERIKDDLDHPVTQVAFEDAEATGGLPGSTPWRRVDLLGPADDGVTPEARTTTFRERIVRGTGGGVERRVSHACGAASPLVRDVRLRTTERRGAVPVAGGIERRWGAAIDALSVCLRSVGSFDASGSDEYESPARRELQVTGAHQCLDLASHPITTR